MADILYRQYQEEDLKRLQKVELEVLLVFDQICKELGLVYFLHYGALIGALRHKGFIPWDDDIDIAMPRKDYEYFVEYCQKHPEMDYAYVDANMQSDFTKNIPLFYKKGTVFATDDIGWKPGIGIDIFVYDFLKEDEQKQKKQIREANLLRRLYYLCYRDPLIPFSGVHYWIVRSVCKIARIILKVLHISPKKLYNRFEKVSQLYNTEQHDQMTTFFAGNPYRSKINQSQFEVKRIEFEGCLICVPKDADQLLRQIYGNYMEIPPKEKRVNHAPQFLDFGEGNIFER